MAVKTIKELWAILDQARGHTTGSHTMQMRAKEEFVGQGMDILERLKRAEAGILTVDDHLQGALKLLKVVQGAIHQRCHPGRRARQGMIDEEDMEAIEKFLALHRMF